MEKTEEKKRERTKRNSIPSVVVWGFTARSLVVSLLKVGRKIRGEKPGIVEGRSPSQIWQPSDDHGFACKVSPEPPSY